MKRFLSKHAHLLLTLVFGVAVFLFWRFRYPFVLSYQEQLQMFLFDGDYFCERWRGIWQSSWCSSITVSRLVLS